MELPLTGLEGHREEFLRPVGGDLHLLHGHLLLLPVGLPQLPRRGDVVLHELRRQFGEDAVEELPLRLLVRAPVVGEVVHEMRHPRRAPPHVPQPELRPHGDEELGHLRLLEEELLPREDLLHEEEAAPRLPREEHLHVLVEVLVEVSFRAEAQKGQDVGVKLTGSACSGAAAALA